MSETHDVVWRPAKIAATWEFLSESLAGSDLYFSSVYVEDGLTEAPSFTWDEVAA